MMNTMVGYRGGLVMRGYARGFKLYSGVIDAVKRSFG
jgi:hypothetical protein